MTRQQPYRPRLPAAPPTQADLAEREQFRALVADSLASVRASAEAWRNGLAAFVALVTTGVVVKGQDTIAGVPTGWRVAITALIALGLASAVVGLWQALTAHAGAKPEVLTLDDIRSRYGSIHAYQVITALRAARRLMLARYAVAAALVLLLTGTILTWWAPTR